MGATVATAIKNADAKGQAKVEAIKTGCALERKKKITNEDGSIEVVDVFYAPATVDQIKKVFEPMFVYKNHVNVDAKTKLLTKFTTSSVLLHDSQKIEELINRDDKRLYSDSAYRSDKIESYLWLKNCKSFVHEKAIGKDRIESTIGFLNLTYNLFRYEQLVRLQKVQRMYEYQQIKVN